MLDDPIAVDFITSRAYLGFPFAASWSGQNGGSLVLNFIYPVRLQNVRKWHEHV